MKDVSTLKCKNLDKNVIESLYFYVNLSKHIITIIFLCKFLYLRFNVYKYKIQYQNLD